MGDVLIQTIKRAIGTGNDLRKSINSQDGVKRGIGLIKIVAVEPDAFAKPASPGGQELFYLRIDRYRADCPQEKSV